MLRRDFLVLSASVGFFGLPGMRTEATPEAAGLASSTLVDPEERISQRLCPECWGHIWGKVTCHACDGTGLWTEASECAGFYHRDAARPAGLCARCFGEGEIECTRCFGTGFLTTFVKTA